jgi:hypothetical protein
MGKGKVLIFNSRGRQPAETFEWRRSAGWRRGY